MLSQKYRLAKKNDFKQVFQKGKRDKSRFFAINFLANNSENSRFAVVTSLRVSKSAVKRNRVKRQIREILGLILPKFKQNNDIIINLYSSAVEAEFKD
ncbi:MAG: ribonuclease P protein component, partial [bacterium]